MIDNDNENFCEVCGKIAQYTCGQCKYINYCSSEHQLEHWRYHKEHCKLYYSFVRRQQEKQVNIKRMELRKQYYQNFSHKILDQCSEIAFKLKELEKQNIIDTRYIFNELEYGISVCLLARTLILLYQNTQANILITSYLDEKIHFLQDLRDVHSAQSFPNGFPPVIKEFVQKKLNLLSSVANILHDLDGKYLKMYQIYTDHIEKIFGENSLEVSNCYFMVGSCFMEKKQYNKSIACFKRASELRGSKGADCYYNLGIIYKVINQPEVGLQFFKIAATLRQKQYSQNSKQAADVYHNIALLQVQLNNFTAAIDNYEKILKIYSKNKRSEEYSKIRQSVKHLEKQLKIQLKRDTEILPGVNPVMTELKKTIKQKRKHTQEDIRSQYSRRSEEFIPDLDRGGIRSGKDKIFKIPEGFVGRLNASETLYLSDLQLQLEQAVKDSDFMVVTVIANSTFLKKLSYKRRVELQKENQKLFQLLSTEDFVRKEEEGGVFEEQS